ncbi:S8 family serine peptidase [Angustibacter sp. McL0619]|uniref:S8 family serine peptidase n=1 Tax=Angustibacter sp. McL0619 TaxID=3415676 RepID=UPI003CF28FB2
MGVALAVPAAALAPSSGSAAPPGPTALGGGQLPARTVAQIDALAQAKAFRTPTELKVDSRLLAADRMSRGLALASGVGKVDTGIGVDKSGRTDVQVSGKVTPALVRSVTALGGVVRDYRPAAGHLLVDLPLAATTKVAAMPGVTHVAAPMGRMTANANPQPRAASKQARADQLRQHVQDALAKASTAKSSAMVGTVTSEGDVTHGANVVRANRHIAGAGVTVGVLSDGVDSLDASIASGDLPADTQVLPGQAGAGDEGTAMLEIVHDLAPTAHLAFATVDPTPDAFAANIRALRAAGADVIVDDVIYLNESPFQDGPIAQAVIDVTHNGALYFSSAGNEQNVDDRTAGNYEGDFKSSGQTIGKFAGFAHDFKPGSGVQVLDPLSADSDGVPALLQWADPLGHSANDYDLYAVDADGNVLAFSNDTQNGDDDPFEGFFVPGGTVGLAVVKFKGANRYFQLSPLRGRFETDGALTAFNTPGVTRGHSTVPAAFSVAAAPASVAFPREIAPGVPNPSGPFPGQFTAAQQSETFTSDGPRRVFFRPNGSAITPGNFTHTGGTLRGKPDITAADGVVTSVPDFERFYGTSAAAPHAAAIAALALSGRPGIKPSAIRSAIQQTAIDIERNGWDRDTGYGILMATRLLNRTGGTAQPLVTADDPTVTPAGDGDEFLEPGESAAVTVPVTNVGDAKASNVAVQLSTTTPGVTIAPSSQPVGSVAVGATVSSPPFIMTVPATHEPGVPLDLHVRVSFTGALSPQTADSSEPVGQPSADVDDVSFTGPPVAIPDDDLAGVSVPLTVGTAGRISELTFSIDGTACSTDIGSTTVGLDHTFDSDLVGTLVSPTGQQVTLFENAGSSFNNFCQTLFTDSATTSIQSSTNAPFTGSFRPAQPLGALTGTVAAGAWTFHVADEAALDTGSIRAVTLHVRGYEQTP